MKGIILTPFILGLTACGYVNNSVNDYVVTQPCCGTSYVASSCCPTTVVKPVVKRCCTSVVTTPVVTNRCCTSSVVRTTPVYNSVTYIDQEPMDTYTDISATSIDYDYY